MNQKRTKQEAPSNIVNAKFNKASSEHRAYISSLRRTYSEHAKTSDTETNETSRVLSNQLILITTVLITANIVFLGNKELLSSLSGIQRVLVLSGLGLLMASLISGIKYYQEIRRFHKNWSDTRQEVVELIDELQNTNLSFFEFQQKATSIQKKRDAHVDDKLINYQINYLYGALVVYFLLVMALVLDFGFVKTLFDVANPCIK